MAIPHQFGEQPENSENRRSYGSCDLYKSTLPYNQETDLKILTIGDPHFKVSNIPESKAMTKNLVQMAREMKPDIIICLGDILDRHETIHVTPLTLSIQFLEDLEDIAPLYVIIGNHDRPNNSDFMSDQHPFNALKQWKNTTVIDTVKKTRFKDKYDFIFVPYVYPGRFIEAISHLQGNDSELDPLTYESCHALFAHQEFFGAKMGAIISQQGDKWPHNYPLVISGHIHEYDRLQHNIIYTGTPMQHAFGDHNNKTISEYVFYPSAKRRNIPLSDIETSHSKNIDIVDESSEGIEGIEGIEWKENRLDLGLIKRIICYIHPSNIMTWVQPTNKLVKLVIRGTVSEIKAIVKLEHLNNLRKDGVKIVYKTVDDSHTEIDDNDPIAPQMPYLTKLEAATASEPDVKMWFDKIFKYSDSGQVNPNVVTIKLQ